MPTQADYETLDTKFLFDEIRKNLNVRFLDDPSTLYYKLLADHLCSSFEDEWAHTAAAGLRSGYVPMQSTSDRFFWFNRDRGRVDEAHDELPGHIWRCLQGGMTSYAFDKSRAVYFPSWLDAYAALGYALQKAKSRKTSISKRKKT